MRDGRTLDVCLIGAQKAGSTSLATWMAQHPGMCHSRIKETHFWKQEHSPAEVRNWIEDQFDPVGDQLLVESSTTNSMYPDAPGVPERLRGHNPEMKILYVLRDPLRRTESHLVHSYRGGGIDSDWSAAMARDSAFVDRSRYMMQLEQYLSVFPRDQIHVVIFEDLVADAASELARIEDFLGISGGATTLPVVNVSAVRPGATRLEIGLNRYGIRMPHRLRQALRRRWGRRAPEVVLDSAERAVVIEQLRDDTARLERFLGRKLDWSTS